MIFHVALLVVFQYCWLVDGVCNHSSLPHKFLFDYHDLYEEREAPGYKSYCLISELFNPSTNYVYLDLITPTIQERSDHEQNVLEIYLDNNMIKNFSADLFLSGQIACCYGKINIVVENSGVNLISKFPLTIPQGNRPLCKVSYDTIRFSNNNITILQSHIFDSLINLTTINLSNNNLKYIDTKAFINLPMLHTINLSTNNIFTLNTPFAEIDKLAKLDLSHNCISNISKEMFQNISSLKILILAHNKLTNISSGVFIYLHNLVSLDISNNFISTIALGSFSGLHTLDKMDLSNNSIMLNKYLLISTPNLRVLDISFNQLERVDLEIFQNHPLRTLDIDGNKFSCQYLIHLIHQFKKMGTNLIYGKETERFSLHGIHCNDTESNEDIIINLESDNNGNNDFVQFLKQGFKDTSFYKYFNTFSGNNQKISIDDKAYADAVKSIEDSSKQIANTLNYTIFQMFTRLQQNNNDRDGEVKPINVITEKPFLNMLAKLKEEIIRFDNSSEKFNKLVSDKYINAMPVSDDYDRNIFYVLIVIMCCMIIIVMAFICNLFSKNGGGGSLIRRKNRNVDVSRSELCTMTETL